MKKITVAYITPPLTQHKGRGIGVYTQSLLEELQCDRTLIVKTVNRYNIPHECDIVHFPYFDPFFLTLPFMNKKPTVITIHDLIPLVFPQQFPIGFRGTIKWQIQKMLAKKTQAIVTDSQTSKTDIIRLMNIPVEKMHAIYLAAHKRFKPINNKKMLDRIVHKHRLPQRFALYVGDVNWNKNVPRLVAAIKQINATLVIVSKALNEAASVQHPWDTSARVVKKEIEGDRRFLVRTISDPDELVTLYNLASVFIYPSLYEGFGLPVLEAMACGCPVVCSDEGSLKEIIGGSALIVDPYNIDSITDGLGEVYFNESVQERYSLAGLTQVKQFSWEKTANQTVRVYHRVLGLI